MPKKVKTVIVMVILAALLMSACNSAPDSRVDFVVLQDRLQKVDAYKQSQPDTITTQQSYSASDATFRGFKFGTSMEMVGAIETLTLNEQFTDALDYTGSGLYGYDMLLTYWFNNDGQLYSASYSMQNGEYSDTVDSLMAGLRGDYGEPYQSGYYDSTDSAVTFNTDEEALLAVDNKGAYYYEAFADDFGTQIEMYARKIDADYDYWVYYTDYSYYNG